MAKQILPPPFSSILLMLILLLIASQPNNAETTVEIKESTTPIQTFFYSSPPPPSVTVPPPPPPSPCNCDQGTSVPSPPGVMPYYPSYNFTPPFMSESRSDKRKPLLTFPFLCVTSLTIVHVLL